MTEDSTQSHKHTPGPWLVLRHGHIKARGGESIGIMHAWLGKVLEQRANARLIAAAPDMLAALSAIMSGLTIAALMCNGSLWPRQPSPRPSRSNRMKGRLTRQPYWH